MEKVIEILESVKPGVNYNEETKLIDDGILESFDIITIIAKLNEEFDVNWISNHQSSKSHYEYFINKLVSPLNHQLNLNYFH